MYSEYELRNLISGMKDDDGNELKLYSKDQVAQGSNIANLLMSAATVDPKDCKDIATAGLLDKVENGDVAVALSEGQQPRSLSAQSGSGGPDAVKTLSDISGKMDQCAKFSVSALGQKYDVSSQELKADTDAEKTFATVSTRSGDNQQKLMQVSAAKGRLLVVATKSGTDLGDTDQKELEGLINDVLKKAEGGSATSSPSSTSSSGSMGTSSPSSSSASTASSTSSATMSSGSGASSSASPTASR
ncbi:hypothetical protein [Pseudarthrobacter niigatensis]|uniref:Uncharacterized protein n=1 Tax=Pseudarthrobacter niigatensis TaxID=369935 RepID=A0AAJ1SQV0_9MICC|nr:hypothetical protein [Pseudarthrobacter niigatensis]MDQ0145421.1 hypothetical protein [Pseudarthrobacter niigatensis]MDQ0265805.1 hypothetical protein [Pseudarthrobacter niigatensis]